MLTNQRSQPKFKPTLKFKQILSTLDLPEKQKDQNDCFKNSIHNTKSQLYQQISSQVKKSRSIYQHSQLPSITKRKSLLIEPISYQINTLDHLLPDNCYKKKKKKYSKFNNLSIPLNNEYINLSNNEFQIVQSIKNSPQKCQSTHKSPNQQKTRKQKLIEFLKGQNQSVYNILQKKNLKDETLLPSFIITKYQELQF